MPDVTKYLKKLKEFKDDGIAQSTIKLLEGIGDDTPETEVTNVVEIAKNLIASHEKQEKFKESQAIDGNAIPLIESKPGKDGTIPVKIIAPGWGTSGYYPSDVLKRDAGIYKEGTKMYWNHPTVTEEMERPERSLNDLAGVLVTPGVFKEDEKTGPGVYAYAKVFSNFQEPLKEMAPYIGLSHIAFGKAKQGQAEGKTGKIVESLNVAESVDFVTQEGAGGKIIQLFESAREQKSNDNPNNQKMAEDKKTNEELDQLRETKTKLEQENARLKETALKHEARDYVAEQLKESKLPDPAKERLLDSLSGDPVKDDKGNLDKVKYAEKIKEAIKAELEYLAKFVESGKITGMNSITSDDPDPEKEEKLSEEQKKKLKKNFMLYGLTEKEAEIAAEGRI